MIFETHAHYDDESFNDDREALIRSLPEKGIGRIINVGASIETTKTTLELAAKYDYIYAAVGVHPSDISGLNEETFAWLKEQASLPKTVAIGEIGLDYYWDKEPEGQNAAYLPYLELHVFHAVGRLKTAVMLFAPIVPYEEMMQYLLVRYDYH